MKSKYGILTFLALAIVLVWTLHPAASEEAAKKAVPRIENSPAGREPRELTHVESYIFISEKNIFHPERKEFPVQAPPPAQPAAEVKKPIVRPQVVLYGVTIAGEYESASISSPGKVLKKGERELQTLRKGASVGDYKLSNILPDRITLEGSEDSFEVLLYDPKVAKKRSDIKTENKPAAVTSLGPAPASASAAAPAPVPPRTGGTEAPKEATKVPERPVVRPVSPAVVTPAPAPAPVPYPGTRGRTVPRPIPRTEMPQTVIPQAATE